MHCHTSTIGVAAFALAWFTVAAPSPLAQIEPADPYLPASLQNRDDSEPNSIPAGLGITFPGGHDIQSSSDLVSVMRKLSDWNTPLLEGDCSPYHKYDATSEPDEPGVFQDAENWHNLSDIADKPGNYEELFRNLKTAVNANEAPLLAGMPLNSYDTESCAKYCDMTDGCKAFNIFFERIPTLRMNRTMCPNPPSQATVVCTLWAASIKEEPKNGVLYWGDFKIVAAGSNVYKKEDADDEKVKPRQVSTGRDINSLLKAKRECDGAPAIHNGGFEMDDPGHTKIPSGWNISQVSGDVTFGFTKPGLKGTYAFLANFTAVEMDNDEGFTRSFLLTQELSTCEGQEYNIGVSYRFDREVYNLTVGVVSSEQPADDYVTKSMVATYDNNLWHSWYMQFQAKEPSYQLAFRFEMPGKGSNLASLDDVTVERTGTPARG